MSTSVRSRLVLLALMGLAPLWAFAEVTRVSLGSPAPVAAGQSFGDVGPYERLAGRIEFALDPADPHNAGIVDLDHARREADGRVHFSADLVVLRPVAAAKANGVLLFDIANRGILDLPGTFNRGSASDGGVGDGLLMRWGFTMVFVGWEADVPAPRLRLEAPEALLPAIPAPDPLAVEILVNERAPEAFLIDDPAGRPPTTYPPVEASNPDDVLAVRDRFFDAGTTIPRDQWRFVTAPNGLPKVRLEGGFEPGRYYRLLYRAGAPVVAGAGLAAIRDAAAAFRYRSDLPVHGRAVYAFGQSQAGRFLREYLHGGFNVDEHDRRVFDAVWAHKAGAARGSFNERFATPTSGHAFAPVDVDGTGAGLLARYRPDQRPKVFFVNTSVEYWGGGRAAALTHAAPDGRHDLDLPDDVRIYLLSGTQHIVPPFPPVRTAPASGAETRADQRSGGQQLNNPAPHANVMRGLFRAWHEWAADGTAPPASRYPRLRDQTLVSVERCAFPALRGVSDPRTIPGPAGLPHLVPQVDRDGNELGGIHDPDVAVPLATTTGWNFRAEAVGNPTEIYQLLGSYIPFARTRASRRSALDPRRSIEERYRGYDDYVKRVRASADGLIRERFALAEDLGAILERAKAHWAFATGGAPAASVAP